MKNTKTVEQLKAEQAVVKVYHARLFTNANNGGRDRVVMSRRDFAKQLNATQQAQLQLDNNGGCTFVEITTPEGQVLKGKYNVPSGRQFNRKLGLTAAIGRALKNR